MSPLRIKNCEVILNEDCNARCRFCYQPGVEPDKNRMPFEQAARVLYEGRRNGCWIAYLIGGEITLREDLPAIVRLARKIGYPCVQVMTNGLKLADRAYAAELVEAGANLFTISVHGHEAALHDRLVGVPGAFRKVCAAMENLARLKTEVRVNNALNRYTYASVDKLAEKLVSGFGIRDINLIFPHYSGMMARNARKLGVSADEAAPHLRRALDRLAALKARLEGPLLINFCPCNLPEAVHLMGEWARPRGAGQDEELHLLDGTRDEVYAMKERIRTKNPSCAECVYNDRCMGFEKWYYDIYGGAEFRPVAARARPHPLKPTHARLEKYRRLWRRAGGFK